MYADLHMHSIHSDGTNTPAELVKIAKERNVSAIALTDHDTIKGYAELAACAKEAGIIAVPGVEISTSVKGLRIHVLGYFIDTSNTNLKKFLSNLIDARAEATRSMLEKLNRMGMLEYQWDGVLNHAKDKEWITSLDVFRAMMIDGYYSSLDQFKDFYKKYFSRESPAYTDVGVYSGEDAVEIILEAGGIPVLAHPALIKDDSRIEPLIRKGLMGIEVYYPAHSESDKKRYLDMANENNLIVTGGTDWHGELTEWPVLMGETGISEAMLAKLLDRNYNSK